jgi:hypothetical protein
MCNGASQTTRKKNLKKLWFTYVVLLISSIMGSSTLFLNGFGFPTSEVRITCAEDVSITGKHGLGRAPCATCSHVSESTGTPHNSWKWHLLQLMNKIGTSPALEQPQCSRHRHTVAAFLAWDPGVN